MQFGKAFLSFFVIIVLLGAGGYFFYYNNNLQNNNENEEELVPTVDYREKLWFTEIYYAPDVSSEFVEIFTGSDTPIFTGELKLVVDDKEFVLPNATNVQPNTYFPVYFGSGTSDLNGTDGIVALYLDSGMDDVLGTYGEIYLKTVNGTVIDYLRWGNVQGTYDDTYWLPGDFGLIANESESLQLFGVDMDSSENWVSASPTPGLRSALLFETADVEVEIEDGITAYPIYLNTSGRYRSVSRIKFTNRTHNPVALREMRLIKEMVQFTLNYYKNLGFPSPVLNRLGKILITVYNKTTPGSEGECYPNGRVFIFVGHPINKVDLKVTVEHELQHLVQYHVSKDSDGDKYNNMPEPPDENNWWEEGMAEYWGVRSAMANYNMTMEQVLNETRKVGSANWWDYGLDLNRSIFKGWEGTWDDYELAFQFIKYIMETYGLEKVKEIQKTMKNCFTNSSKSVSARKALEKVLNRTMDDVIAEFYLWRVFDRQNGTMPEVTVHRNVTFGTANATLNDPPLNKTFVEHAEPGAALVQRFNLNGSRYVELNFTVPKGGKWKVIVRVHYKDGSIEQGIEDVPPFKTYWLNPAVVKYVDVIKVRCLDSNSSEIRVTLGEVPGKEPQDAIKLPAIGGAALVKMFYWDFLWYYARLWVSRMFNFTLWFNQPVANVVIFHFKVFDANMNLMFDSADQGEKNVQTWITELEIPPGEESLLLFIEIYAEPFNPSEDNICHFMISYAD